MMHSGLEACDRDEQRDRTILATGRSNVARRELKHGKFQMFDFG